MFIPPLFGEGVDEEEDKESTTNTASGNTSTKPSKPSTGGSSKPEEKTEEDKPKEPEKPEEEEPTEPEVTYSYQWEKVDTSVGEQYYLYIVSSEGKKVAGTATVTTNVGGSGTVNISTNGTALPKNIVASVTNIKVAN